MATIFTKIAAGEIPSYKCAESADFYAFLDISPLTKGHTLVIPRKEVDYIFDMDDAELAAFQVFAKKVAQAIRAAFPCRKVAQVVLGLEVPHAHQFRGRRGFPQGTSLSRARRDAAHSRPHLRRVPEVLSVSPDTLIHREPPTGALPR